MNKSKPSRVTADSVLQIAEGRTDLVFDHLARSGAATDTDENGVSLIQWCAYYGDVSAIRYLLSHGASLTTLGKNLGLNTAAFHGHWRLCKFLLENDADANVGDDETGETPLHSALGASHRGEHDLVIQVLLSHGAKPNVHTRPGVETGAFMRDVRTRGETPLHRAAAFASEETIQRLLGAGATPDAKDANGDTPLSWASWHCRPDPILRLLCYGKYSVRAERRSMARNLLGDLHS